MRDKFPTLVAFALLFVLVLATWWAADYADRALPVDPPARKTHEMDAWARSFTMLRTDPEGLPVNRLEGDYSRHYPDDDSYDIENPRAIGLQPGNPVTIGVSDTAIMDQDGSRIVMTGNAHINRAGDAEREPLDVRSQQLTILPDSDEVFTDLPAEVTQGRSRMNGTGMRYNNRTRQLQVFSASDVEIAGDARSKPAAPARAPSNQQTRP